MPTLLGLFHFETHSLCFVVICFVLFKSPLLSKTKNWTNSSVWHYEHNENDWFNRFLLLLYVHSSTCLFVGTEHWNVYCPQLYYNIEWHFLCRRMRNIRNIKKKVFGLNRRNIGVEGSFLSCRHFAHLLWLLRTRRHIYFAHNYLFIIYFVEFAFILFFFSPLHSIWAMFDHFLSLLHVHKHYSAQLE